jgi:hypothetical protein
VICERRDLEARDFNTKMTGQAQRTRDVAWRTRRTLRIRSRCFTEMIPIFSHAREAEEGFVC